MTANPQRVAGVSLLIAGLATIAVAPRATRAQDMASIIPADAVLYFEWTGHNAITAGGGRGSAFGKMMADPEVKRLLKALGGAVQTGLGRATEADEAKRLRASAAMEIARILWADGVAVALVGVEASMVGPVPQLVIATRAHDSSTSVVGQVELLLKDLAMMSGPTEEVIEGVSFKRYDWVAPLRLGVADGIVLLTVGEPTAARILEVISSKAPALSSASHFVGAMKKIGTEGRTPVARFHLDVANLLAAAREVMTAMTGQEELPPTADVLIRELGIGDIQSVTAVEQIVGSGHQHSIYLATTGSKKGFLKLFDSEPVTEADLVAIPSDATLAKAVNFPLASVYGELLRVVEAMRPVNPQVPAMVAAGIAALEDRIGMKVKEDILDLLDDGWVVFDSPGNGGLIFTGFTVVVETKDAEQFEAVIRNGLRVLKNSIAPAEGFTVRSYEHAGHQINFVNITAGPWPVAPSWSFHKNRLVLALYPQMVAQTVERLSSPAATSRSILENPQFVQGRKLLPEDCTSIAYLDTRRSVSDLYAIALPLASAGCSLAQRNGVDLDVSLLPRREVLVRDLFADVWGSCSDEEGVLIVGYGPWPVPVPSVGSLAPALLGALIPRALKSMTSAGSQQAELAPEDLERLKALGYIATPATDQAEASTQPSDSPAEERPTGGAEPAPAEEDKG